MQKTLRIDFLPHEMLKNFANIASSWTIIVEILNPQTKPRC